MKESKINGRSGSVTGAVDIMDEKQVGKTRNSGFQIGMRRTLPISLGQAWRMMTSPEGLRIWLGELAGGAIEAGADYQLAGGCGGKVTTIAPLSHIRLTWRLPDWPRASILQMRLIPNGERSVVAFHQEQLPGPEERKQRGAAFQATLEALTRYAQVFQQGSHPLDTLNFKN